jgi:hypothetical protein
MSKCFEVILSTRVTVLVELGDDGLARARAYADIIVPLS